MEQENEIGRTIYPNLTPNLDFGGIAVGATTEISRAREINIQTLNYGYIVSVGCHRFAIETHEKMITKLSEYYADPAATEKKWFTEKTL